MNANIKTTIALRTDIIESVLTALSNGKISEAVDEFDDQFTFIDQALELEFTDKERLTEFFEKSREAFPHTVVNVNSILECGNHIIVEWKITANRRQAHLGPQQLQIPISFPGASVVRIENEKITHWSDYYDSNKSWRFSLAAFFKDWVEI